MALADLDTQASYTGDGSTDTFAINFDYQDEGQVKVYVDDVLQVDPTDYSISGSNVVFVTAPASSAAIVIKRVTALVQDLELPDTGTYRSSQIEEKLDRIVMMIQELEKRIDDLEV